MSISDIIKSVATDTDIERLKRLPCAEDFYGMLLRMIPLEQDAEFTFADLGSADGFVSALILENYPNSTATLIDVDEERLNKSEARFSDQADRVNLLHADFARSDPPDKYGLVVTTHAIHHLTDIEKRALYRTLYSRLHPGGAILNGDRVLQPTDLLREEYRENWANECRAAGADEDAISKSLDRMWDDHDAEIEDQIEWIRNAGFRNVDIYYKYQMYAVFGGRRPDFTL